MYHWSADSFLRISRSIDLSFERPRGLVSTFASVTRSGRRTVQRSLERAVRIQLEKLGYTRRHKSHLISIARTCSCPRGLSHWASRNSALMQSYIFCSAGVNQRCRTSFAGNSTMHFPELSRIFFSHRRRMLFRITCTISIASSNGTVMKLANGLSIKLTRMEYTSGRMSMMTMVYAPGIG
jgi:hypothetical protein